MHAPPCPLPDLGLRGRVAVITGGTRGLGRAIAEAFLTAGCEVTVCGRHSPPGLPAAEGRTAEFHACDVRDPDQARRLIDSVAERCGRLDILVNNAGGSPQAVAATASHRFSETIVSLNLLAPLYLSQAAFRWMQQQPSGGSIVNIASISGVRPSPGTAIYGAAKAGLIHLTRSLAQEWGPQVRVNALIVGLVRTEAAEVTYGSQASQAAIAEMLPLRRMGQGEDIAAATLYLASDLASYISGASLSVDGGGERPLFLDLMARTDKHEKS